VVDLFLDCLDEPEAKLVEYGVGGLCNLCLDPLNSNIILKNEGISLLLGCLSSSTENTVVSTIYILYHLSTISTQVRKGQMIYHLLSPHNVTRIIDKI
jgi:armadillo repeat-containing protein 7